MQFWCSFETASKMMQFWCSFKRKVMQFWCSFETASKLRHFFRQFFLKNRDFLAKKLQMFQIFSRIAVENEGQIPTTYYKKNHVRIGRFLGRLPSKSVSCCIFHLPGLKKGWEPVCQNKAAFDPYLMYLLLDLCDMLCRLFSPNCCTCGCFVAFSDVLMLLCVFWIAVLMFSVITFWCSFHAVWLFADAVLMLFDFCWCSLDAVWFLLMQFWCCLVFCWCSFDAVWIFADAVLTLFDFLLMQFWCCFKITIFP